MPDAILLAGTDAPDEPNKAFLEAAGRPLVWHVARALDQTAAVGRIVAVGPVEEIRAACGTLVHDVVPAAGSVMTNVIGALAHLSDARHVLAVASDIPLLTSAALEEFLEGCTKGEADFYYAIVPQTVLEDRYPGARKTFIRVMDGAFTGGSVMLFNPAVVDRVRGFVEKAVQARKKPWLLAGLFGWSTVMKLSAGRLSIAEVEQRAHEVTGVVARAVIVRQPEVALDVDAGKPENLEIVRRALSAAPSG